MKPWSGLVWRHLPAGAHPLNFGYIVRAQGRWNRAGVYGCLYTSLTKHGAIAEYRKLIEYAGAQKLGPREVVSIEVRRLDPVVDLTDQDELAEFGVKLVDEILADSNASLELCRTISDEARRRGAVGLIAPSAALRSETNVMIYQDGLARGIDMDVGPDREAIP